MIPLTANFYDTLSPVARRAIDAASRYRTVKKGDLLTRQGQANNELHQIVSGEVKVSSTSRGGRETVAVIIRAGGWVSLSEVFSGLPSNADVTALTPVRVRVVSGSALRKLIAGHPEIAERLLQVLSQRFSILYHLGVDRSTLTLKQRVIKTLYMQAYSHRAQNHDVLIALPQEELGKLLACGRQALNRVLKELEREGLLEAGYGGVRLRSLDVIRERYADIVDVAQPVTVYGD